MTTLRIPKPTFAALIALVDAIQLFGYLAERVTTIFVVVSVALKIVLAAFCYSRLRFRPKPQSFGILYLFATLISGIYNGHFTNAIILSSLSAVVSIGITISALHNVAALERYLRVFVRSGVLVFFIYIAYVYMGRITDEYGRYFFFGEYQPNAGSEIAGALAIAGLIALPPMEAVPVFGVFLYSMLLMQGRGSLLGALVSACVYGYQRFKRFFRRHPILSAFAVTAAVSAIIAFGSDYIVAAFNSAFLVDDENRGAGTGFSGRTDNWSAAMELFYQSPIFGGGEDAYAYTGLGWPHNYFIFGLSTLGGLFILLFFYLTYLARQAYRVDRQKVMLLSGFLALMMFNAKFFNATAYPYLGYVILLALSQYGGVNKSSRRLTYRSLKTARSFKEANV